MGGATATVIDDRAPDSAIGNELATSHCYNGDYGDAQAVRHLEYQDPRIQNPGSEQIMPALRMPLHMWPYPLRTPRSSRRTGDEHFGTHSVLEIVRRATIG